MIRGEKSYFYIKNYLNFIFLLSLLLFLWTKWSMDDGKSEKAGEKIKRV